MTSIRVIPTILTDGITVVKGTNFDNWRTVGNVEAIARLFANRNVDEFMFLDVKCRAKNSVISVELVSQLAKVLRIPFSVGGGISNLEQAEALIRCGAEKIVLGTAAIEKPKLITEIASKFGSQSVTVALDFENDISDSLMYNSGSSAVQKNLASHLKLIEELGAGEILIQNKDRDGNMRGYDINHIQMVSNLTKIPTIASSGCGGTQDAIAAIEAGANGIAIGALFQFTEFTPRVIKEGIAKAGIRVRRS